MLLVSTYSPLAVGGIGQFVHDHGIALKRRGHSPTVIYRYEPPEFPASRELQESVRLVEVRPWDVSGLRTYSVNRKTVAWIQHHWREFDVFHVLNPMPMAAAALRAGHRHGVPSVVTIYAKYPVSPKWMLRRANERAESTLLREADVLVYESESTMRAFAPHEGRVILNGIDTSYFRPRADLRERLHRSLGIPPDEAVLLFLGRMDRLKGIYIFLEAVAALRKRFKGFSVLLVGSVELADIPERIRDLGIGDIVRLIGPVGKLDVLDYYCASDVFVLPSYLEGISSSLIEAMACGLPALATRVGGNTEVVRDGIDGMLIPPGDPGVLADAMERLGTDVHGREEMGASARRRIEERFSLNSMTSLYVSAYEEALARRTVRPAGVPSP